MEEITDLQQIPLNPRVSSIPKSRRLTTVLAISIGLILTCTGALYLARPVARIDPDAPPVIVEVQGMHCPLQCGLRVKSTLETIPWVVEDSVSANPRTGLVSFRVSDGDAVDEAVIRRAIERAGFGVGQIRYRD